MLSCVALFLLEAPALSDYNYGSVPGSDMTCALMMAWTFVVVLRVTGTGVKR